MSGNHFLRSMAEPAGRGPESNDEGPTPEVHFAETVSVVTEVNKLAEAPLVDIPLELTAPGDTETANTNDQIRRSASRDRDMKEEEGLVLKAVPREPSEDPVTAAQTAEVAEGVENLEIAPNSKEVKKRKQDGEGTTDAIPGNHPEKEPDAPVNGVKSPSKTRRGSTGGKRRGPKKTKSNGTAENEPAPGLRRSKRRKST